jgi:hypothetical protein
MKWLERLRAKTATPTGDALTKLTKVAVAGSVSVPSGGAAVCTTPPAPSLVETKGDEAPAGQVPLTRSSATAGIGRGLDRAREDIAVLKPVSLRVCYQRIWYDYKVADGAYTPGELHRAGKVVRPWGPVQYYTLLWRALEGGLQPTDKVCDHARLCSPRCVSIDEPPESGLTKLTKGAHGNVETRHTGGEISKDV